MPRKSPSSTLEETIQLHMSAEMMADVARVAGVSISRDRRKQQAAQKAIAAEIRTAIRYYLQNHEQLIGSRRYFTKTLQTRFDKLGDQLAEELATARRHQRVERLVSLSMLATIGYAVVLANLRALEAAGLADDSGLTDAEGNPLDPVNLLLDEGVEIASLPEHVNAMLHLTQTLRHIYSTQTGDDQ
jgi:hypothetical protein